jgi:hypothetical protein
MTVEEVRRARAEIAARNGHDLLRIVEDVRCRQGSEGHPVVSYEPADTVHAARVRQTKALRTANEHEWTRINHGQLGSHSCVFASIRGSSSPFPTREAANALTQREEPDGFALEQRTREA